ncbi:tRNA uridine(34) 5-carboxymethylaminomethyl modification radical SAM/GNAT enzyme Elp3 [Candidatus Falkowbacteria bacterium CG10_big_fil_rev_8_21_14_0_10_39_11]|uniref:tRNA carboxymethyluridine synthase n=1 Tax=Candidatus Falkowbacteria bacterium CG10_big_fil_rev_8_21_14_0_10_39_11 TaxID=1974565 RepID=A0A2H0V6L7_9BACT|nr:MAG: tRNA uridine(34) 5-carboxymethylaminomethyl modification radical SAM/GNAT enzyme Elp3 [Candidatus Falkowbacteria bacterium CG10_big_fil_rev_8_21_14_0_10_39_11]
MKQTIPELIVLKIAKLKTVNKNRLVRIKNKFSKDNKSTNVKNSELLAAYHKLVKEKKIEAAPHLVQILKKRAIRTMSGVAPVAVLTKPDACPGNCLFCPNEKEMPKSYLSNEPAVMRAIRTDFDPFKQVSVRIHALKDHGHETDKIELIIMGGTFSHFPEKYQTWFVKRCFDACNSSTSITLAQAQKKNETAKHRIIGLTLETRPDYITEKELLNFRRLGCTKIEIGVQAIDDKILKLNRRGSTVADIEKSTKLMKDAGFKIAYHMMPNLMGSTPAKDLKMFKDLFSDPAFQPDMLKIYPTVVTKDADLFKLWQRGRYKPYTDKQLINLLKEIKLEVPYYVRIIRLIRDIPSESIEAGNKVTNLRQILKKQMLEEGQYCKCIRCREARENTKYIHKAKLFVETYSASEGQEFFLHYTSSNKRILYAFLRLRLNNDKHNFIPELEGAALIREVHTYGQLVAITDKKMQAVQHMGFGKKLLAEAEKIALKNGFTKMAVISGIGVRGYYRKQGYRLQGTYMVKQLSMDVKTKEH